MGRKRSNLETVEGVSIWRRAGAGPRERYRITYKDPATGKPRTETVSADRDLTLEVARERQARQVRTRKGLTDPVRDRWAAEDQRPIEDHLKDWAAAMLAAGLDAKHRRQLHDYAKAVLLGNEEERRERTAAKKRNRGQRRDHEPVALKTLGIRRVSQIVASKVQGQIGKVKASRSAATATRYLDAVNVFLNWGVGDRRWERNACHHLPRYSAAEDRRLTRRAVEVEDFRRLIEVTEAPDAPKAGGLTGLERSRLYRFTVASGFRRGEVRGVRVMDLQQSPTVGVWTRASISRKNKRRVFVGMPHGLIAELLAEAEKAKRSPEERLFKCPADTARMLRVDLERAGIPYKTEAGTFDFHAVRHTTATLLISAGVTNIKAIQEHMRHSRADMTTDTYGHLLASGKEATAKALPDFTKGRTAKGRAEFGASSTEGVREIHPDQPAPSGAQRQEQSGTGTVRPSTSAKASRDGAENLDNPPITEWSDGESNPDLLNAIQPSNSSGNSRQAVESSKACASSENTTPATGAAPAAVKGRAARPASSSEDSRARAEQPALSLADVTRAGRLARAEGRTPTARSVSAKIVRATRELTGGGRG